MRDLQKRRAKTYGSKTRVIGRIEAKTRNEELPKQERSFLTRGAAFLAWGWHGWEDLARLAFASKATVAALLFSMTWSIQSGTLLGHQHGGADGSILTDPGRVPREARRVKANAGAARAARCP